jgi:hypothetical protein
VVLEPLAESLALDGVTLEFEEIFNVDEVLWLSLSTAVMETYDLGSLVL